MSSFSFPGGNATILRRDELALAAEWQRAFQPRCKDHRYYEIIADTLDNDFHHQYLLLRDDRGCIRGIQPFFILRQNLVEGIPPGAARV